VRRSRPRCPAACQAHARCAAAGRQRCEPLCAPSGCARPPAPAAFREQTVTCRMTSIRPGRHQRKDCVALLSRAATRMQGAAGRRSRAANAGRCTAWPGLIRPLRVSRAGAATAGRCRCRKRPGALGGRGVLGPAALGAPAAGRRGRAPCSTARACNQALASCAPRVQLMH